MERAVPKVASEEIELYLRTYYSLLRTSTEVKIRSLVEAHAGMNSLLHSGARQQKPDMSAFIYALLRVPAVMHQVKLVILGQSPHVFAQAGVGDLTDWETISAPARRRRTFYNGEDKLAVLIASRSDIDDIVPILTAYQIEWNKLNILVQYLPENFSFSQALEDEARGQKLAEDLQLSLDDLTRLQTIWGEDFDARMQEIRRRRCRLRIQLLNGSLTEYRRATHSWWDRIEAACPDLDKRPIYFVSSNAHSLINIVTGYALQHEDKMVDFLGQSTDEHLLQEWRAIQAKAVPSSRENFFYYLWKKYAQTPEGQKLEKARKEFEKQCKIVRVSSEHSFDIEAQLIPLSNINRGKMDPRLRLADDDFLDKSDALILNIDYPLGLAAYQVLTEIAEHVGQVLGVYAMGKAATLNGVMGDVMIPGVVYDEQSHNTFLFPNCFQAEDVAPYLVYGTVLDNQKAVTVRGTFLQNHEYMDVFYREGYTDIEMEAGPYLSAVYEMVRPKRHPVDEIINLYGIPIDLGLLHYASDKPLSKGKNLGVASLSYFGMDPTYATTVAILKRVFAVEQKRLKELAV